MRVAVEGMAKGYGTAFIDAVAYGKGAEAAAKILKRGWLVAVDGRLEYREWEQDGRKRHDYSVVGTVEFLAAPKPREADALASAAA